MLGGFVVGFSDGEGAGDFGVLRVEGWVSGVRFVEWDDGWEARTLRRCCLAFLGRGACWLSSSDSSMAVALRLLGREGGTAGGVLLAACSKASLPKVGEAMLDDRCLLMMRK